MSDKTYKIKPLVWEFKEDSLLEYESAVGDIKMEVYPVYSLLNTTMATQGYMKIGREEVVVFDAGGFESYEQAKAACEAAYKEFVEVFLEEVK